MRAVVDTNVLIRAIIKPLGTVGPVLQRLTAGDYHIVYSRPLLDELVEKLDLPRLKGKYGITVEMVAGLLAVLSLRGELVMSEVTVSVCRDPEDNMVIEAALAGNATVVVTGDEDLLILRQYEGIEFVTPRAFLARLDEARGGRPADSLTDEPA